MGRAPQRRSTDRGGRGEARWLAARRCWREAGQLLRLGEARQPVSIAELLPAGDAHLARRAAMREDEQRLHYLPTELPMQQLKSVNDEAEPRWPSAARHESSICCAARAGVARRARRDGEPLQHLLRSLRACALARAAAGDAPAMLAITPCSHAFHASCLDRWLRRASRCPLQRARPRRRARGDRARARRRHGRRARARRAARGAPR